VKVELILQYALRVTSSTQRRKLLCTYSFGEYVPGVSVLFFEFRVAASVRDCSEADFCRTVRCSEDRLLASHLIFSNS
jgi:hypothetical protein